MLRAKEFTIELEKIDAGENPLRLEGENKGIAELSESIKRIGLINPLVVAPDPNGDHYRLIAGHRRFAACRRAGLKEVAVRITQTDQREICEVALAENLVVALIREGGMTTEQVATVCNRPIGWVKEQEEILSWPPDVREAVHDGWLSAPAASNLALVHNDTGRRFLLSQAKENGVTVRTTAAWLQAWRSSVPLQEAVQAESVSEQVEMLAGGPQSSCFICEKEFGKDGLSSRPICPNCILMIREAGSRS
ncbi:MAG: ParB/RepB/Spo0J family partition protein [Planctomycetota bacterium]|jgi:ParB family chromosome partitioning protein